MMIFETWRARARGRRTRPIAPPEDDVDPLTPQFPARRPAPSPPHTHQDAPLHRIQSVSFARSRRCFARPPGSRAAPFTSTDALVDLGDLLCVEFDEQTGWVRERMICALALLPARRRGCRPGYGRPAGSARRGSALAPAGWHPSVQVDDDVLLLEPLHDAGGELALATLELVVDACHVRHRARAG